MPTALACEGQRSFFLAAADISAMTRPPEGWPLRSSLEASFNSRFVGMLIVSFVRCPLAILSSLWNLLVIAVLKLITCEATGVTQNLIPDMDKRLIAALCAETADIFGDRAERRFPGKRGFSLLTEFQNPFGHARSFGLSR
jgi:hypothetical protein